MSSFVDELAHMVRFHRRKSGLSQAALAQVAGVGKTVIFDVEHAKATVQLATVLRVLAALNISLVPESPLMAAWRTHRERP